MPVGGKADDEGAEGVAPDELVSYRHAARTAPIMSAELASFFKAVLISRAISDI